MRIKNIPIGSVGNAILKGKVIYADVEQRYDGTYVILQDSRDASELAGQYPQPSWRLVPYDKSKIAFYRSK